MSRPVLSLKKSVSIPVARNATPAKKIRQQQLAESICVMQAWQPELFGNESPVPLKIGIRADILLRADCPLPRQRVKRFLGYWCGRPEYKAAVEAGAPRVGLSV